MTTSSPPPLRLPQISDLGRLRLFLQLLASGLTHARAIGERMGAKPKHSARHAAYHREAAEILGLVEPRRWVLTAHGKGLLAVAPNGEEERELLRDAVAGARALGPLAQAVLAEDEPALAELLELASNERPDLSAATLARRVGDVLRWRSHLATPPSPRPRPYPVSEADLSRQGQQLDLLTGSASIDSDEWPDPMVLPFNWPPDRISVERIVHADLRASNEAALVVGYASLQELCELVANLPAEQPRRVRVVFGTEPFMGRERPDRSGHDTLDAEVRDYWLERGISIIHARAVLATIEALRTGRLTARISRRSQGQHAKIFAGEHAITIGSSNLTRAGLAQQLEANVRLVEATAGDRRRVAQARRLVEIYWKLAAPFDDGLLELLELLLRNVSWQESLSRACAELLEGEWARTHLREALGPAERLWPSQVQGIGQALYVLMEVGSVLVADATGSGKTKSGAWLLRALRERLVAMGRPIFDPVLVTPPAVIDTWLDELQAAEIGVHAHSHGTLSHGRAAAHERVVGAVEAARILAVDEAHNFINDSNRTAIVNTNLADHVVLFTATPINRDVSDLLGIVDLLGADNLDDETLAILEEAGWRRRRSLTEDDKARLRQAVKRFMVRRTKRNFNALIDREPGRYANRRGQHCRYPEHRTASYELRESRRDRAIGAEITELARSLRGVSMFQQPLRLTRTLRALGWTEDAYVAMRLRSATALARYQVRVALRSSRAALWEHLHGTLEAKRKYAISRMDKEDTGEVLVRLRELRAKGPPRSELGARLPEWLRDREQFERACDDEIGKYERIGELCDRLSAGREHAKVRCLRRRMAEHGLVVAFDSRPITLFLLRDMLASEGSEVLVATGGRRADQRAVQRAFGLGSASRDAIALCSNSMAEGINLQQASAIVHLDMPSVVRIAEQRVGRIDRMDSPHAQIESWWPRDAEEFALSSDEKLGARLELVGDLLGANIELPGEPGEPRLVRPEDLLQEMQAEEQQKLELLDDAFAPVRGFVEGPGALVEPEVYAILRRSKAKVLSSIAVVGASYPWGLFTVPGTPQSAPRWIFVDGRTGSITTTLEDVAQRLRERLPGATDVALDHEAIATMEALLDLAQAKAGALLPRRKQRALEQMRTLLERYERRATRARDIERLEVLRPLLGFLAGDDRIDLDELAEAWLSTIGPRWRAALHEGSRRPGRLRRLQALVPGLLQAPLGTEELRVLRDGVRVAKPLGERIVAAIVGVLADTGRSEDHPAG